MKTYRLHDTFNGTVISNHRTLLNAVKARAAHARAVRRRNGSGSYVTYKITTSDGSEISAREMGAAVCAL